MVGKRITKKNDTIKKFGTTFKYYEINGTGHISVIFNEEVINTINFWDGDRLKNFEDFEDAITCWCDKHIA